MRGAYRGIRDAFCHFGWSAVIGLLRSSRILPSLRGKRVHGAAVMFILSVYSGPKEMANSLILATTFSSLRN